MEVCILTFSAGQQRLETFARKTREGIAQQQAATH